MARTFFRILLFIIALDICLIPLVIFTPFLASENLTDHAWKIYAACVLPMLAFMVIAQIKDASKMPIWTFGQKVLFTAFVLFFCAVPATIFLHVAPYFYTLHFHEETASIFRVKSVHHPFRERRSFHCQNGLTIDSQPLWGSRLCVDQKASRIVEDTLERRGHQSCGILVTGRSSRYGMIPDRVSLADPTIERPCYVQDLR